MLSITSGFKLPAIDLITIGVIIDSHSFHPRIVGVARIVNIANVDLLHEDNRISVHPTIIHFTYLLTI